MAFIEVLFLIIFWTWVLSAGFFLRNTVLPRAPVTINPAQFGLAVETVHFQATDGLQLEGWKIPGDPAQPWIICCHGLGSNRSDMLHLATSLHRAGFNLFLFDFRGHGGSAGLTTSFGWQEQRDLEGVLAFLGQQSEVPSTPYGLYGLSMGAAAALLVGARDERIGAIVADSPFTNLEESFGQHLSLMYPMLPRIPFIWFINTAYKLRYGIWPVQVAPQESLMMLQSRQVSLIYGAQDTRMPPGGVERMLSRIPNRNNCLVVGEAGHLQAYAVHPDAYLDRLIQFFLKNL